MYLDTAVAGVGGPFDDFIIRIGEHFGKLVEEFGYCAPGCYGGGG